jgi:hypothetical protein
MSGEHDVLVPPLGGAVDAGDQAACCRALKLPTMPSLSMHGNHGVVRRHDDGVLDMMLARKLVGGLEVQAGDQVARNRCPPQDRSLRHA